jgi:hypothetical protein
VVLSNSDLSKQLSQSLATLADVQKKARKLEEEQSQDDIILLMGIGGPPILYPFTLA